MTTSSHLAAIGCLIALWMMAVSGCASTGSGAQMNAGLRKITPSFMLSEHDRAQRKLKDPESLNLKYAQWQERIDQPDEARKSYELVLRDDPKSVEATLGVARLDQLADKPKDAESGFQKALRMKPNDPAVLAACGQFYASQKRWPEAFQALNGAIAAAPKDPAYKFQLAKAKTQSGDVNGGLALFTQLVGNDMARYNVAFLLRQEGKTEAAVQQCQLALEANPSFEPARTLLDQLESPQMAGNPRGLKRAQKPDVNTAALRRPASGIFSRGPTTLTQTSMQWSPRASSGNSALKNADATFAPAQSINPQPSAANAQDDPWASTPQDSRPAMRNLNTVTE